MEGVSALRVALAFHIKGRFAFGSIGCGPRERAIAVHLQPASGFVHEVVEMVFSNEEGPHFVGVSRCHWPPIGIDIAVAS